MIINICKIEVMQIAIMESKRIVKKSVYTYYEEVSWIENGVSVPNTPKKFLYKCIEKLMDLGNYLVFVVTVIIEFFKGRG